MLLRTLNGPGTGPSPICLHVWDDGAVPAGGDGFRAVVWATSALHRRLPRRAVLYLRER